MRALAVLAHPAPGSFNHALFETAVAALRRRHHVDAIDLYAEDFQPAMTRDERLAYDTATPILDPSAARYAELVRAADILLFVYPTWWSAPPAILKGWLEKVMAPGVAFVFDDAGKVAPGLRNVRRIVGISTYGSSRSVVRLVNDNGRRILLRALRLCTGVRTRATWLGCYDLPNTSADQRAAFLSKVESRMAAL